MEREVGDDGTSCPFGQECFGGGACGRRCSNGSACPGSDDCASDGYCILEADGYRASKAFNLRTPVDDYPNVSCSFQPPSTSGAVELAETLVLLAAPIALARRRGAGLQRR